MAAAGAGLGLALLATFLFADMRDKPADRDGNPDRCAAEPVVQSGPQQSAAAHGWPIHHSRGDPVAHFAGAADVSSANHRCPADHSTRGDHPARDRRSLAGGGGGPCRAAGRAAGNSPPVTPGAAPPPGSRGGRTARPIAGDRSVPAAGAVQPD